MENDKQIKSGSYTQLRGVTARSKTESPVDDNTLDKNKERSSYKTLNYAPVGPG